MKLATFIFALIALSASQCVFEGNTYNRGELSITFGKAVDGFVPAVMHSGDAEEVYFTTWNRADAQSVNSNRWQVKEWGATGEALCGSTHISGRYDISFNIGCTQIHIQLFADYLCQDRAEFFSESFSLEVPEECGDAGHSILGQLEESAAEPALSGMPANVVYGHDGYTIMSVGNDVAIFQRWSNIATDVRIEDLMSFPDGFSCDERPSTTSLYILDWVSGSCGLQMCGQADHCIGRAQLLHQSNWNSYDGFPCDRDFDAVDPPDVFGDCSDGSQWNEHPYECIDQAVPGGCAFCGGRVEDRDINICFARRGVDCQELYEQSATETFCNLAFECPASTLSLSVALLVSCIVSLFFAQ